MGSFGVLTLSGIAINLIVVTLRDATALGVFNLAYAVYIVASQLAVCGIHYSVLRASAHLSEDKPERRRMLATATAFALVAGLIVAGAVYLGRPLFLRVFGSESGAMAISYAGLGLALFPLNKVLIAHINGLRHMRAFSLLQAARYVLVMLWVAWISGSDLPFEWSGLAFLVAEGVTTIESAACEPEVVDLANFLIAMGAKISGIGSPTITITGVKQLHGAEHEVIPDRIEAATYAIAAAVTDGEVTLKGARADHLHAVTDKLREAGVVVERKGANLVVRRNGRLKSSDVTTLPYAGFPTDVQAQMMALMTLAPGISIITERIFESRFMHVSELARLGADVEIEGPSAIVKGGRPLSGAPVMASDLRASAALVIAGLAAKGTTQVNRVYHIDRGYENIDGKLRDLGARIQRIEES